MDFTVGRAAINDLPGIKRLYEQLIECSDDIGMMRKRYAEILKDDDVLIVVAKDAEGNVIGSVNGYVCPIICWGCSSFMAVEDVIVDEEYRKRGVGTAMMAYLDDFAARKGCSYAILVSTDKESRKDAHRFYESIGYNKHGDVKGFRKIYSKERMDALRSENRKTVR
jgi:GNAT superfamily N-acetyltransferase